MSDSSFAMRRNDPINNETNDPAKIGLKLLFLSFCDDFWMVFDTKTNLKRRNMERNAKRLWFSTSNEMNLPKIGIANQNVGMYARGVAREIEG